MENKITEISSSLDKLNNSLDTTKGISEWGDE